MQIEFLKFHNNDIAQMRNELIKLHTTTTFSNFSGFISS